MFGVVALAISSATKLYPALLLSALLIPGQRIKGIFVFGVSFALLYLPFLAAGCKVLGFLPIYLQNPSESFNLGLKYLMMGLFPQLNYDLLSIVFLLILMVSGGVALLRNKPKEDAIRYAYLLMGLLIVLMPASLHPWYVIILIPFLCFYPAVAWLLFSCTVTLSYFKYLTPSGNMPIWVLVLEYGLLFTLLAFGFIFKQFVRKTGASAMPFEHQRK
jgi:hypothetical protein